MKHSMHQRLRERDFKDAEEVQRENQNDDAEDENEIGIGELRRPGDLMASRFQRDEQQCEPDKPNEYSGNERNSIPENTSPIHPGVFDETENLERDHRQDARHQIQD